MISNYNKFINESIRDKMTGISEEKIQELVNSAKNIYNLLRICIVNNLPEKYYPSNEEVQEYMDEKFDNIQDKLKFLDFRKIEDDVLLYQYLPEEDIKNHFSKIDTWEQLQFAEKWKLPEKYYPSEENVKKFLDEKFKNKYYIKSTTFPSNYIPSIYKVTSTGYATDQDDNIVPAVGVEQIDSKDEIIWHKAEYFKDQFREINLKEFIEKEEEVDKKRKEKIDIYKKELSK